MKRCRPRPTVSRRARSQNSAQPKRPSSQQQRVATTRDAGEDSDETRCRVIGNGRSRIVAADSSDQISTRRGRDGQNMSDASDMRPASSIHIHLDPNRQAYSGVTRLQSHRAPVPPFADLAPGLRRHRRGQSDGLRLRWFSRLAGRWSAAEDHLSRGRWIGRVASLGGSGVRPGARGGGGATVYHAGPQAGRSRLGGRLSTAARLESLAGKPAGDGLAVSVRPRSGRRTET